MNYDPFESFNCHVHSLVDLKLERDGHHDDIFTAYSEKGGGKPNNPANIYGKYRYYLYWYKNRSIWGPPNCYIEVDLPYEKGYPHWEHVSTILTWDAHRFGSDYNNIITTFRQFPGQIGFYQFFWAGGTQWQCIGKWIKTPELFKAQTNNTFNYSLTEAEKVAEAICWLVENFGSSI